MPDRPQHGMRPRPGSLPVGPMTASATPSLTGVPLQHMPSDPHVMVSLVYITGD